MRDTIKLRVSAGDKHGELAVAGYQPVILVVVLGVLVLLLVTPMLRGF